MGAVPTHSFGRRHRRRGQQTEKQGYSDLHWSICRFGYLNRVTTFVEGLLHDVLNSKIRDFYASIQFTWHREKRDNLCILQVNIFTRGSFLVFALMVITWRKKLSKTKGIQARTFPHQYCFPNRIDRGPQSYRYRKAYVLSYSSSSDHVL